MDQGTIAKVGSKLGMQRPSALLHTSSLQLACAGYRVVTQLIQLFLSSHQCCWAPGGTGLMLFALAICWVKIRVYHASAQLLTCTRRCNTV